jgi:hypothetical protein
VSLLVITSVIISGAAIIISSSYYSDKLLAEYAISCRSAARQIAFHVDPAEVDRYLRQGEAAPGYHRPLRTISPGSWPVRKA